MPSIRELVYSRAAIALNRTGQRSVNQIVRRSEEARDGISGLRK